MSSRRVRLGALSFLTVIVVFVIAIAADLLISLLPSGITGIDLTMDQLYTLSDQTLLVLDSLDSDVDMVLLAITGQEDETLLRLLGVYASASPHIRVKCVDPAQEPAYLPGRGLEPSRVYANSVLVERDGISSLVDYTDIYVTGYNMDKETQTYTASSYFNAESVLTGAVYRVSRDDLPVVYFLTGHGESPLTEGLQKSLELDAKDTSDLSLISLPSVPDDAGCVVINAPSKDISPSERDILIDYLDRGGNIFLVTGYMEPDTFPCLREVPSHMSLRAESGLIVETRSGMNLNSRYPYYLLPDIETHDITNSLIGRNGKVLTGLSQPIVIDGGTEGDAMYLLYTSPDSYSKKNGLRTEVLDREDGDASGPFHPGAVSEKGSSRLVWIASGDFLSEEIDGNVAGGNSELFLNAVEWMTGTNDFGTIRLRSLDANTFTVSQAVRTLWMILLVFVVPLLFPAIGIIVVSVRRRR